MEIDEQHVLGTSGSALVLVKDQRAALAAVLVLQEMGCPVAPETEIRVWDTTADTRFMVLPMQPPETIGWPEDKLAAIVTRDSLIGVARLTANGG